MKKLSLAIVLSVYLPHVYAKPANDTKADSENTVQTTAVLHHRESAEATKAAFLDPFTAESSLRVTAPVETTAKKSELKSASNPMVVRKTTKSTAKSASFTQSGVASWYGKPFHGRKTASGTIYDMYKLTAAHRTLPLNSKVRVTNTRNNKSITVLVNDRGPYIGKRVLDLSYAAAKTLGIQGLGHVTIERIN